MGRSVLTVLLVVMCSFRISSTGDMDSQIMNVADSQMGAFLAKIEPGKEADYGFTDQDDLDGCVVGKPYRKMELTRAFYYEPIDEHTSYLTMLNKWLVPVSLNHQYRVFLNVEGNPGNLHVAGMGSAKLAKELQLLSMGAGDSDEFYVLKVPRLAAEFFVHESDNSFANAQFTPLESAIAAIPSLSGSKENYTLAEIQRIIKDAVDRQAKK